MNRKQLRDGLTLGALVSLWGAFALAAAASIGCAPIARVGRFYLAHSHELPCVPELCTPAQLAAQAKLIVTVDLGPRHDGRVTVQ